MEGSQSLAREARALADELECGHYGMTDAIAMIRQLAARLMEAERQVRHARSAAISAGVPGPGTPF